MKLANGTDMNLLQKPVPTPTASRRSSVLKAGSVVPVDLADAVSNELRQWERNETFG